MIYVRQGIISMFISLSCCSKVLTLNPLSHELLFHGYYFVMVRLIFSTSVEILSKLWISSNWQIIVANTKINKCMSINISLKMLLHIARSMKVSEKQSVFRKTFCYHKALHLKS